MALRLVPIVSTFPFKRTDKIFTSVLNNKQSVKYLSSWQQQPIFTKLLLQYPQANKNASTTLRCYSQENPTAALPKEPKKPGQGKTPMGWKNLAISSVIGAVLLGYFWYLREQKREILNKQMKRAIGKVAIGGRFDLVDHDGNPRKSEDFFGSWLLIYFGFSHCPDICPDEMEKMAKVADVIENKKGLAKLTPIFISVDPERDTPPVVKKYIREFSDKIVGLTGTIDQVAAVCKAFRVYFSPGPKDVDEDYIVDHTIIHYLVDPQGNFIDYYGQTRTVDEVVAGIELNMFKFDPSLKNEGFFSKLFNRSKEEELKT